MLHITAPLDYPLKGSRLIVLQCLQARSENHRCVLSYEEIAEITGYCAETIRLTVRQLSHDSLIRVEKNLGERRNIYRILLEA